MSDTSVDSLVTLQERMVNLIKQLNMPLVEVSMVIQNMISPMLESLITHALDKFHDDVTSECFPASMESYK